MEKEKISISSRKIINSNYSNKSETIKLPAIEVGSTDRFSNTSQDNFFRKSGKGFNSMGKSENYGIIKSDLFQLQEMINENSYYIKMYKISSKSPVFTKRLTEIEENKEIKLIIDKMTEDSMNIEKTGKAYNCTNSTELIQKLTLDVSYDELLLKKLNEYFLLLHLKISGEENLYQETYSKFFVVKLVLEKLLEKYYAPIEDNSDEKNFENLNQNTTYNEISNEIGKLSELKSIEELYNFSNGSDNPVARNLIKILSEFLDKLYFNYNDIIHKFSTNSNDTDTNFDSKPHNFKIENFFTQKLLIEKCLYSNEEKFKKKNNDESEKILAYEEVKIKLEKTNKILEEELNRLKTEIQNSNQIRTNGITATANLTSSFSDIDTFICATNKNINNIINENLKSISNLRIENEKIHNKLLNEIQELSTKYEDLSNRYSFLLTENELVVKKLEILSKSVKKDADFESYEQLMQEQFDTMKISFVNKIEILNRENNRIKIDSRMKINNLQDDLTEVTHIKDLFLRQITELNKLITR